MDPQLAILLGLSGAAGMAQAPVTGSAIGDGPLYTPSVGGPPPPAAAPAAAPAPPTAEQTAAEQPPTDVSEVEVTAHKTPKPAPPPVNYDNSNDVQSALAGLSKANAAAAGGSVPAQGGSANPGIFGLLPQSMQHGTLRNVLGAIGDAFLVQGGGNPEYANNMQRQSLGNAMAGVDMSDPASVRAAATRMAVSGSPGAVQDAMTMSEQAEQAGLRRQMQAQSYEYKQGMLNDRNIAVQAQRQSIADRYTPQIGGMLSGVKTAQDYAAVRDRLLPMAQQLGGPDATPESVWGLPSKEAWQPGMTTGFGMTSNNQQVSADKGEQRKVSMRDTDVNANSRIAAARIGAASRPQPQPTMGAAENATFAKANRIAQGNPNNESLTPVEQALITRITAPPRGNGRRPVPASAGGAPAAGAGGGAVNSDGWTPQQQAASKQFTSGRQGSRANPWVPVTSAQFARVPSGAYIVDKDGAVRVKP